MNDIFIKKRNIKRKGRINVRMLIAFLMIIVIVWVTARANCVAEASYGPKNSDLLYSEQEQISKAVALSYFVYGCEGVASENQKFENSQTVSDILECNQMRILTENFGLKRTSRDDPTTAIFDTADYIATQVGELRFLTDCIDKRSSFYGAAFCDDKKKCVWITYTGAISFADSIACLELVLAPTLSSQEKRAFMLYENVVASDEVKKEGYGIILTGHSLGGGLATMVSYVSECSAVTVNGVNGLALDKINAIKKNSSQEYDITNYLAKPEKGQHTIYDFIQRLMFLGSYRNVACHVCQMNDVVKDSHCAFSFLQFENEDYLHPTIPTEIQ